VEFRKDQVEIHPPGEMEQVMGAISGLGKVIVVNISAAAGSPPILLTEENLKSILAEAPGMLTLESVSLGVYRGLIRVEINSLIQSAMSLRASLRKSYLSDLVPSVREFLALSDKLRLLLGCYALQAPKSGVGERILGLRGITEELANSDLADGDNVLWMDALQYEILPVLKALLRAFHS
jgi:hypothetical protein